MICGNCLYFLYSYPFLLYMEKSYFPACLFFLFIYSGFFLYRYLQFIYGLLCETSFGNTGFCGSLVKKHTEELPDIMVQVYLLIPSNLYFLNLYRFIPDQFFIKKKWIVFSLKISKHVMPWLRTKDVKYLFSNWGFCENSQWTSEH